MYEGRMKIYNDMLHEFGLGLVTVNGSRYYMTALDGDDAVVCEFYTHQYRWFVCTKEGIGVEILKVVSMILDNLQFGEPDEF